MDDGWVLFGLARLAFVVALAIPFVIAMRAGWRPYLTASLLWGITVTGVYYLAVNESPGDTLSIGIFIFLTPWLISGFIGLMVGRARRNRVTNN